MPYLPEPFVDGLKEEINEGNERLRLAYGLVSDFLALNKSTLNLSNTELLNTILSVTDQERYSLKDVQDLLNKPANSDHFPKDHIVISCESSITKNPDGLAAVGFVIRFPAQDNIPPIKVARTTPSKTVRAVQYDSIYESLVTLFNIHNSLKHPLVIRIDSQWAVQELTGKWKASENLNKIESINEFIKAVDFPVTIEWRLRNSTPDLTEANFLAQEKLSNRR